MLQSSSHSRYNSISGTFYPSNPAKCKNKKEIKFKSKLEYLLMRYLDKNPMIAEWDYEKVVVPYFDKTLNRRRRYFIDFVAKIKCGFNTTKTSYIEVKSKKETVKPEKTARQSLKTYNESLRVCKWEAARKFATAHGSQFIVITEDQLL